MQYFRRNTIGKIIALGMAAAMLVAAMPASFVAAEIEVDATNVPVTVFSGNTNDDGAANEDKIPMQVNAHMGDDPATQMNITYSTIIDAKTQIVINKAGSEEETVVQGESSQAVHLNTRDDYGNSTNDVINDYQSTNDFPGYSDLSRADIEAAQAAGRTFLMNQGKWMHKIAVSDLEPGTEYEYTVGYGANTYEGKFKTAPAKGSKETFNFVYVADTQVSNVENAKALGATLERINEMNPDFVYLSGDTTDTAAQEAEWEVLFNNEGKFPNGGQNMFGNNTIAVTRGNHDNNILNRHINAPGKAGNIVFSYDYGTATFVILNLELQTDANRAEQEAYLREVVADAKARGQWTIVGFHKSLYSGANHIDDNDVVSARRFWSPIFAELDIDIVMQGHDHVYSRGFITADGQNAKVENIGSEDHPTYNEPSEAPLYMVGGHAGGLKWYEKTNYNATQIGPIDPNYGFLDVNSAGVQADGTLGSEIKEEQWIVNLEVSDDEITVTATAFKYDTALDEITTEEYVYDEFTVKRDAPSNDGLKVTTNAHLESGAREDYFDVNTSLSEKAVSNAATITYKYDTEKFDYRSFEAAEGVAVLTNVAVAGGRAITVMIEDYAAENFGAARFSGKEGGENLSNGRSSVDVSVDYVVKTGDAKTIENATGSVSFTTGKGNGNGGGIGDYDGDGKITLIDLSNVIDLFGAKAGDANWDKAEFFDVNNSKDIDIFDISSIAKEIE